MATFVPRAGSAGHTLPAPPVADREPRTEIVHGVALVDDYFWLREKANPRVTDYLQAEDRYADEVMAASADLQETIYKEILGYIKETDESVPYRDRGYFYYVRTQAGLQYPIFCRKRGSADAPQEVILDQNELAKGHAFLSIGAMAVSDDGRLLAYTVDVSGYRQYTLHVKDLTTGELRPDRVERVDSVVWAADNRTLYFTTEDPVTKRTDKFFVLVLGRASELIFEEADVRFDLAAGRSRDRTIVFLQSASKTSTEFRYMPATGEARSLRIVVPREPDHEYDVAHRDGVFYIRTNRGAKNFRIVTAPVDDPAEPNWTELVPHRPHVKVAALDVFARHAVLSAWENGLQQIEILDLVGTGAGGPKRLTFPEPVYSAGLSRNPEFDTNVVRYGYQSLVTPPSVFEYDLNTGVATRLKEMEVPGGFDRSHYASERVFATAPDGTRVPISLAYRTGVPLDGSAPLLLYGYGSYGISIAPAFASSRLPLLDRGMIYAIAHVRGGGELGEEWREQGRMMKKMNTFTDFIAAAECLLERRYTSANRLAIQGGSAGGLLVCAAANLRPDLFRAVVAQVPFVDVVNTMLDASLPLTTGEYLEWGNPNDPAVFEYLRRYSPYENVRRQAYPATLVKVSINDSQVPYWEGAKLVARLRALKTNDRPLLLKVNFGAGHGGASGRYEALREVAFNWAFVITAIVD